MKSTRVRYQARLPVGEGLVRSALVLCLLTGCYTPPNDLEIIRDIPMVASNACQSQRTERVACVIDGDTFDVGQCDPDLGERFRMLGIDAPETAKPDAEADCWADVAYAEVERILGGRTVTLTFDEECEGVYGRTLAYVWITGDDVDAVFSNADVGELLVEGEFEEPAILLNEYLLLRGFVELYDEEFAKDLRFISLFSEAQGIAQAQGAGLWTQCTSDTP